jgi:hypothetical protein
MDIAPVRLFSFSSTTLPKGAGMKNYPYRTTKQILEIESRKKASDRQGYVGTWNGEDGFRRKTAKSLENDKFQYSQDGPPERKNPRNWIRFDEFKGILRNNNLPHLIEQFQKKPV